MSSRLYIDDEEDSAITINGKKNKLELRDFQFLAESLGIHKKPRQAILDKFARSKPVVDVLVKSSALPDPMKIHLLEIVANRYERFLCDVVGPEGSP